MRDVGLAFSPPVRAWFDTTFAEPTAGPGAGLAGHRRRATTR